MVTTACCDGTDAAGACVFQNGWTSLINAAYWCQPDACTVLVENKCNVHLKNKVLMTVQSAHVFCRVIK